MIICVHRRLLGSVPILEDFGTAWKPSLLYNRVDMEFAISIQIEQLLEGIWLATSDELSCLVAQGRTVAEALDIARGVPRKLIEARRERESEIPFSATSAHHDYTIVVAA
jgi:predicted RNase H-like HicB family nuclease